MTSEKQIRANQRNALKSTGPKTPKGKAAIRHNALKHGLLSQEILLPGEDGSALKELDEGLRDELQPVGELENMLVDKIIAAAWRLHRLGRVEAGIFVLEDPYREIAPGVQRKADNAALGLAFIRGANGANAFSKLSRYETTLERSLYRSLHELQRLQVARRAQGNAPPPVAVDLDVSGLSGEEP